MADKLDTPLPGSSGRARRTGQFRQNLRRWPLARIAFGLLLLLVLGVAARLLLVDDPQGGRPYAEVGISSNIGNNDVATEVASQMPPDAAGETAEEVAVQPGGPSITIIGDDVPDTAPDNPVGVAALTEFGVVPELIEETQNGPIPRVGPDGQTPFAAYARASVTPATGGQPLVSLVVTGLGISESGTRDAIEKLSDNITLAFAPYGHALQSTAAAARAGGHELLLQIPLEPFDYPDNDPGPQTLLTGQPPRANLDKLFWLLARLGGYTGLINHMGARFTASAADFGPVMEELGARGLGYIDDGSSNRSVAANLAQTNRVPFRRADLQIDAVPARAEILANLDLLERRARENGAALGIASALPVTVQSIAEWAEGLEERGVLLVPASALMTEPDA